MPSTRVPTTTVSVGGGPPPPGGYGGAGLSAALTDHITDSTGAHAASAISYAGGASWLDGVTNPATTVEAQLDKFVTDLSSETANVSGARKIGSDIYFGVSVTLPAGPIYSQLVSLVQAEKHDYVGGVLGGPWADGTTNPATTVDGQLTRITQLLSSTSGSGLDRIGCKARTTWLGGRTNPAGTAFAVVDKIITDLSAQTAADDGAKRIGAEAGSAGYSAGSVRSQLDQIGPGATVALTGARTFDNITTSGTNKYKLTSRSLTRVLAFGGKPNSYTDWTLNINGTWAQVTTNSGGQFLIFELDLPNGATLTSLTMTLKGHAAHGGTPGTLPSINFAQITVTTGFASSGVATFDPYTSAGTYEGIHTVTLGSIGQVIDKTTQRYFAFITGEGGANYVAGLLVYGVTAVFTTAAQDDGAA